MNYYFEVLKKYFVFSGRARRKEYWMFFLFNIIIAFALGLIESIAGIAPEADRSILAVIYQLVILIPNITVGVRRMHDINKSGWYLLIPIFNLILLCEDGTKGDNKYGADPKELENQEQVGCTIFLVLCQAFNVLTCQEPVVPELMLANWQWYPILMFIMVILAAASEMLLLWNS